MKTIKLFFAFLLLGTTSIVAQTSGNALNFDGINDYVTTTLPTVFSNISNNNFTIEMWVNPKTSNTRVISAQFDNNNRVAIKILAQNEILCRYNRKWHYYSSNLKKN